MWCTPGPAPVAIEERQTGVSDGKTEVACRYVAVLARGSESAGARPLSTARSNAAGVIPSTTIRTSFLHAGATSRACSQTGVALGRAPAQPRRERGQRERLEIADDGNEGEGCDDERGDRDERLPCRPRVAAAPERAADDLERAERARKQRRATGEPVAPAARLPARRSAKPMAAPGPPRTTAANRDARARRPGPRRAPRPRRRGRRTRRSSTSAPTRRQRNRDGGTSRRRRSDPQEGHVSNERPLLVFFTSRRSGPARRMESLLAHIARKERGRCA